MAQPIQIAEIGLTDERGCQNGTLRITSANNSKKDNDPISEASNLEMEIWGEERFQLLENGRYEFKILYSGSLRIREVEGIITNYKLEKNTGLIEPGSNVGLLTLELEDGDGIVLYTVSLEVRSSKLQYREHYRQMLDEIADECSELLMQLKSPVKGLFKPNLDEPAQLIAQKYAFLKHLIASNEFKSAIAKILTSPHIKLISEEEKISTARGFKPTYKALRQLSHKNPRSTVSVSNPIFKLLPTIPTHINVQKQKDTVDTEENKFVKHVISSFLLLLWSMEKSLQRQNKLSPSDNRLIKDIGSQKKVLSNVLSHDLFVGLSELKTLNLGSPVLQRKAGYREVLNAWIKYNVSSKLVWSGGLDVYGGGKRDVDSLYEYWVFFKLLKIVTSVFKLNTINKEELFEFTEDGFGLKLKAGKSLLINGTSQFNGRSLNIKFAYNRVFNRKTSVQPYANYPEQGSWTKIMRPDYTISVWPTEVSEKEAEYQELMVHIHFDAKYKFDNSNSGISIVGLNQDEDLDIEKKSIKSGRTSKRTDLFTLHTYRDAIRRTEGAYIIYPGDQNDSWRQYHEILPGIGAFAVRPEKLDQGVSNIEYFLKDVLVHLTNRASQREVLRYNTAKILGSQTFESHTELPELEGGKRTIPLKDHYLIITALENSTYCWMKENLVFLIPFDEGELDTKLFLVKHVFLKSMSEQSELFKINGSPYVLQGNSLISFGFPGLDLKKSYLCFKVAEDKNYKSIPDAINKLTLKSSLTIISLADLFKK